ncbi:glutamate receptor U1-like [Periplaneta americana]|uniref:glutamate receptor U1-like n=1 Tax=Periplaneta americana TaxID=6978 RepID=UPI0037E70EFD
MKAVLWLSVAVQIVGVSGSLHDRVGLVTALQEAFTSRCLYLLRDQEEYLNTSQATTQLGRMLFSHWTQTTLSSRRDGVAGCRASRPIYILPDEETHLTTKFVSSAVWLKFLQQRSLSEFFRGKDVPFNCEFLVARRDYSGGYALLEVYRITPNSSLQTYQFGNWSSAKGLDTSNVTFYDRRNSLSGTVLTTAIPKTSPLKEPKFASGSELTGVNFFCDVWITLQKLLDFKPEYRVAEVRIHGVEDGNGTWNGILGMMQRKEAEVTCEDLSMLPSRAQVVDFMVPLQKERQFVILKKSDAFQLSWTSFLLPFSTEIWVATLVTMGTVSCCLWFTYRVRRHYWKESLVGATSCLRLHDLIFFTFGSFCLQGHDLVPISSSGRIVFLVSYLTAVVLLAGYSASLISYLTVRQPVVPFTTFEGLLRDGTYKFGVPASSSAFSFFRNTTDKLMQDIYWRLIAPQQQALPRTTSEGLQRVCEDYKYAFLATRESTEQLAANLSCRLTALPRAYLPGSRAMAVARGSPYLGVFSHFLQKLDAVGILRRLKLNTSRKPEAEEPEFVAMDISSVAPMFAILAAGLATSLLILSLEIVIYKQKLYRNIFTKDDRKSFHFVITKT